ncbi:GntR family transcriptional regulator [Corynebacterium marinum]|uniref:GntR family transcriptional regulator n=1 Tax=Corynebacterium marinum DSM 44953 TaxID=1224162 RepID=A0A0B6TEY6_9CORY|nr:GntR family transcriptional regulator [Corynebacterium marinum]AJK68557.1 GntR family transcriptional regulator [Corynebacterium marinum DSM 44953]GGO14705.1 GntR family transcriptional regulator [Corynebacterium marinum]
MRADSAASAIRKAISAGDFEPGEQLIESEMAERLDVSRNTLREAFAMLIADGVVVRIRNRGVFIASLGEDDVRDLYLARAAIEPAAIAWGQLHDVAGLADVVGRAETALAAGRAGEVALANQQFHRQLVAGMGSATLDETMDRLLAQMRLVFLQVLRKDPGFHGDYVPVNRHVVELMSAGCYDEAATVLHDSLVRTGRRVQEILGE